MCQTFEPLSKSTVAKFTTEGTVRDLHRGRSGRKRSGCSEDFVDVVRQAVVRSPKNQFDAFLPKLTFVKALFKESFAKIIMLSHTRFKVKVCLPTSRKKNGYILLIGLLKSWRKMQIS